MLGPDEVQFLESLGSHDLAQAYESVLKFLAGQKESIAQAEEHEQGTRAIIIKRLLGIGPGHVLVNNGIAYRLAKNDQLARFADNRPDGLYIETPGEPGENVVLSLSRGAESHQGDGDGAARPGA
jgi:hypothetical protein